MSSPAYDWRWPSTAPSTASWHEFTLCAYRPPSPQRAFQLLLGRPQRQDALRTRPPGDFAASSVEGAPNAEPRGGGESGLPLRVRDEYHRPGMRGWRFDGMEQGRGSRSPRSGGTLSRLTLNTFTKAILTTPRRTSKVRRGCASPNVTV